MSCRYYFETNPLLQIVNGGAHIALFLDFDGSLAPITKNPALPRLPPDTKRLLESILGSGRSVVTIASGRPLADLRKRVSVEGVLYIGSHGLEISGHGIRFVHKGALLARPAINALFRDLTERVKGRDGIVIEKKPYSLALHYRGAGNGAALFLRRLLEHRMAEHPHYQQLLSVGRGKKVLELVPRLSWGKGAAALHVMEKLGNTHVPVCCGDDLTDETLFEAFSHTGVTVRVGPSQRTAARYYVRGQWEVPIFLRQLNVALQTVYRKNVQQ